MEIKVLGSGCKKCNLLEEAVVEVAKNNSVEINLEHINDFAEIAKYGVMSTPALVVEGKVVSQGKLLNSEEILGFLR